MWCKVQSDLLSIVFHGSLNPLGTNLLLRRMIATVKAHKERRVERELPAECPEHLPEQHIARKRMKRASSQPSVRRLSCTQRGRLVLLAALLQGEDLPIGRLLPEMWPETVVSPKKVAAPSKLRQREKQRQRKRRQKKAARSRKAAA